MAYEGFRPDITPLDAPFWDALRRHQLVVQQCDDCGALHFVPSERCHHCGSAAARWTGVSGDATVYTFSIVHRAPSAAYQADVPYAIAYVELAEGPRMPTRLVDVDPSAIEIGMPVKVVFDDVDDDLTLYRFRPRDAADEAGDVAR
jgi:uncharacterized OB-fold protein